MLVLTRDTDDRLTIVAPDGTRIAVLVCAIRGDTVRLGIDAPKSWTILRNELLDVDEHGFKVKTK